jgi:hypothetical protein
VDPAKTLPDPADYAIHPLCKDTRCIVATAHASFRKFATGRAGVHRAGTPISISVSVARNQNVVDRFKVGGAQLSSDTAIQIAGHYSHIGVVSHLCDKLFDTQPIYRMIDQPDRNTKKEIPTKCDDLQSRGAVVVQAEKDCRITILNKKSMALCLIVEKLFIDKQVPITEMMK